MAQEFTYESLVASIKNTTKMSEEDKARLLVKLAYRFDRVPE